MLTNMLYTLFWELNQYNKPMRYGLAMNKQVIWPVILFGNDYTFSIYN